MTTQTNEPELKPALKQFKSRMSPLAERLREVSAKLTEHREEHGDCEVPELINRDDLSEYTVNVLESFGTDCAGPLNEYCTGMEDILKEITQSQRVLVNELQRSYDRGDDLLEAMFDLKERLGTVKDLIDKGDFETLKDIRRTL